MSRASVHEYGWGSRSIASPTLRLREERATDEGDGEARVTLEIADALITSISRIEDAWGGWRDTFVIMRSGSSVRLSGGDRPKRDEVVFRHIRHTGGDDGGSASGLASRGRRSEELSRSGSEAAVRELLGIAAGRMAIRAGAKGLVGSLGGLRNTNPLVAIVIENLQQLAGTDGGASLGACSAHVEDGHSRRATEEEP